MLAAKTHGVLWKLLPFSRLQFVPDHLSKLHLHLYFIYICYCLARSEYVPSFLEQRQSVPHIWTPSGVSWRTISVVPSENIDIVLTLHADLIRKICCCPGTCIEQILVRSSSRISRGNTAMTFLIIYQLKDELPKELTEKESRQAHRHRSGRQNESETRWQFSLSEPVEAHVTRYKQNQN